MNRKHGSRWIVAGAAVIGFAALHLVPRLAVSMPGSVPTAAQAGYLADTDPIENTFAQLNDQPAPDKDTFTIRGRVSVDAGATPVADGVANGVTVTILESSTGAAAACGGFTPVDTKTFPASQCKAVERGRSLYCTDTTTGSFFRLRRSSSPTSFRVNTIVRGREIDPGRPFGVPLAGDVLMTQAHWFGQTEVNRCRVTQNGERTTCRSKGISPLPPPCPTPPPPPTPTPSGPTPTPAPTPTPSGPTPTPAPNCGEPGPITGPEVGVCSASNVNYALGTSDANSYSWSLPAGVTISGPSNLSSVNLDFGAGFTSGTITVTANYDCGSKTSSINVDAAPDAPSVTPSVICPEASELYTAFSAGASSYSWTPSGDDYSACTDSPTCSQFFTIWSVSGGSLSVTATNACGTSAATSFSGSAC